MNNNELNDFNESVNEKESLDVNLENAQESEYQAEKESIDTNEDRDLKSAKNNKVKYTASIGAVAVIGVVSLSVITSSGLINLTMDGSINDIVYKDDGFDFDIDLKDVKSNNKIYFEIISDKEDKKVTIIDGKSIDGNYTGHVSLGDFKSYKEFLEDSSQDTLSYKVRLCGDTGLLDRTYASKGFDIIRTDMKAGINDIVFDTIVLDETLGTKYLNTQDGYLKFTIDYVDNFGLYTSFKVIVKDSKTSNVKIIDENMHDMQSIVVINLESNITFEFYANEQNEVDLDGNRVYKLLAEQNIKL